MKEVYLKPFILAAELVYWEHFKDKFTNKTVSNEKTMAIDEGKDIVVSLGIKGQIKGLVVFALTKKEAMQLSTEFLARHGEENYQEWDETTQSAILEYGNVMVGNVVQLYDKLGIKCEISTPRFIPPEQFAHYHKDCVKCVMSGEKATLSFKYYIEEAQG